MFNSGELKKKGLKLKLSRIQYKRSQMYHPDKRFYCHGWLFIPKLKQAFTSSIMITNIKKNWQTSSPNIKAGEYVVATCCIYGIHLR